MQNFFKKRQFFHQWSIYPLEDKTEIVFIWGDINQLPPTTAAVFNKTHPGKNITRLCQKLRSTGYVANLKRSGTRFFEEGTQIGILRHFAADLCTSVR